VDKPAGGARAGSDQRRARERDGRRHGERDVVSGAWRLEDTPWPGRGAAEACRVEVRLRTPERARPCVLRALATTRTGSERVARGARRGGRVALLGRVVFRLVFLSRKSFSSRC
jgi:hypothetical protein